MLRAQKFIKNQTAAARRNNACCFSKAGGRVGYDGEDQMQDGMIKTAVSKRQAVRITLYATKIQTRGSRPGTAQHRMGQIQSGIAVLAWQVRQIQPGADAVEQHARRRRWQGRQAFYTLRPCNGTERRVVERRNQRVAVFEALSVSLSDAQCSTRGMAVVNAGTTASNCVPSSAVIW